MASALIRMMKKAAASSSVIIPLPNETTPLCRKYTTAILSTPMKTSCTTITNLFRSASIQTHRFSSLAETDNTLLSFVEAQIDSTEKKFRKLTEGFPFKIVDNPEETFITLTREYKGEEIEATVHQPHDYIYYEKTRKFEVQEEVPDDQKEVHFFVRVSNKNGLTLMFSAEADAKTDGMRIKYLVVEDPNNASSKDLYEKPNFSDLSESLRKDFHNYLEVRGFEPSNTKFLRDYMITHRKHMKCTPLLQDLKTFIAE